MTCECKELEDGAIEPCGLHLAAFNRAQLLNQERFELVLKRAREEAYSRLETGHSADEAKGMAHAIRRISNEMRWVG
jgi:hypothetical protein